MSNPRKTDLDRLGWVDVLVAVLVAATLALCASYCKPD